MIEQVVAALLDRVNQLELANIRLDARIDALIERVNQLEGENIRLAARIERLETTLQNVAVDQNKRIEQLEEEAEERTPMVLHPEDFFTDDSYICKLCGYHVDEEEDFVGHILDAHATEARASNAVTEYWDVDSIALAEEFNAN